MVFPLSGIAGLADPQAFIAPPQTGSVGKTTEPEPRSMRDQPHQDHVLFRPDRLAGIHRTSPQPRVNVANLDIDARGILEMN